MMHGQRNIKELAKEIQFYIICSWCNLHVAGLANNLAISITRLQTKITFMRILKYLLYRTHQEMRSNSKM